MTTHGTGSRLHRARTVGVGAGRVRYAGGTDGPVEDNMEAVGACAYCRVVREGCTPATNDGEALKSAADTTPGMRYGCSRECDGSGGSGKVGALSETGAGRPGGAGRPRGTPVGGQTGGRGRGRGSVVGVKVR